MASDDLHRKNILRAVFFPLSCVRVRYNETAADSLRLVLLSASLSPEVLRPRQFLFTNRTMEAQRYLHSSSATSSRATSRKPPGSVTLSRRDGKRAMNSSAASSAAVPGHSAGLPPSPYAMYAPPSPYLEDLTKSLVTSQPARRKLHLVQRTRII